MQKTYVDKVLLTKIYKNLLKPNNKKMNNPIKKRSKRHKLTPHQGDMQMTNKHMKSCPPYVIRKLQIQTTMSYHYTRIKMDKVQNGENIKCW